MDSKLFHRRVWGIVFFMALMTFVLGSALYDAQIVDGPAYAAQSVRKIASTETVEAARGQILDRYGRVLVSNETVYQVTLNTSLMKDDRNGTLRSLLEICREEGVEWSDTLGITASQPFRYTATTPFYSQTTGEDGAAKRTLTRLGQLALKMKWISANPTQEANFHMELPTADALLDLMCTTFGLAKKGEDGSLDYGDLTKQEARDLAGVLYELYLRSQDIYFTPYVFAEDVDIVFTSKVKERALSGVVIEATTARRYHTEYAAHLLGRVGLMSAEEWAVYQEQGYQMNETVGKEGAELAFESYLRGESGRRSVERNTEGKVVSETWLEEPEPGGNVVLTIDIDLQKKVEDTLAQALPNLSSEEVQGAACVITNVKTGEALAIASYPTFNLSTYSADYADNLENPLKPLYNRATLGTYAPGSTFKMVTAIAGLEEGVITPTTRIRDTGRYTYWDANGPMCWIYRQYGGSTHGWVNVSKAIEVSCNYFFFDVGRQVGIDTLGEYAAMFGLGEKSGLELPESAGVMAGREYTESVGGNWYEGNVLSVAIGQESSQFTPAQLATYIGTMVNGGTRFSTHILKEVKSNDFSQVTYTNEPVVVDTINIDEKNLAAVKEGMLSLTTGGSVASYFRDLGVQVGAKTGSAQVSAQTESNAVFVCFAPYDDPQIAMALVVERGGSGSELGRMAAEILEYYFSAQQSHEELTPENKLVR